jgi:carotenoid 1,2-hydratase
MKAVQQTKTESFSFASSIKEDVWHPNPSVKSYEWWYFDALSDNGRDGVVIIFLDNFVFSPRYNSLAGQRTIDNKDSSFNFDSSSLRQKIPAIAFVYYRDGKPLYRAYNEYPPDKFWASEEIPTCVIGNNSFKFESAPYGSGYTLSINAVLRKNLNLEAHFEWVSIESDFTPERKANPGDTHIWNLVVPRSDVTGRITVSTDKGLNKDVVHFRGTGYHDHNLDNRWLPETVQDWQWGRAHFADATAVFYRYKEHGENEPITKLYVVRHGELRERDANYEEQTHARDKFGIKYPTRLRLVSEDNMRLRVKQIETIDSSFFYLRFLSEMTLTLRDGKPRKAIGFTEHLAPKSLKYRWLDFLVNMRIGRNGKGSFLP